MPESYRRYGTRNTEHGKRNTTSHLAPKDVPKAERFQFSMSEAKHWSKDSLLPALHCKLRLTQLLDMTGDRVAFFELSLDVSLPTNSSARRAKWLKQTMGKVKKGEE